MSTENLFNVLLLGAGPINFGTPEGPWNHSKRLEQKLGTRLRVVGIVDMNSTLVDKILTIKRADDNVKAGYENTICFPSIEGAAKALTGDLTPHLTINGFQGKARGTTIPGSDTDLQCAKYFPDAGHLIEKPISATEDFEELDKAGEILGEKITSVGYMLRYLRAVTEMKKIIDENKLNIMAIDATYLMAYAHAGQTTRGMNYFDKRKEPGPVVGQGTHILDLARYLSPEPILSTIHTNTVESLDPPGKLSKLLPEDYETIPPESRIPRITSSTWRLENGGIGSFTHGICLHEGDYDVELVVLADGWKLRLVDPYGVAPRLYVRSPGGGEEVQTVFKDDDCYYGEMEAIVDVIEGKADRSVIRSPYKDAMKTYKFTWAIRYSGEETARARGVL